MERENTYLTDSFEINISKMRLTVINRRTERTEAQNDSVRADVERRLYEVFCKYARHEYAGTEAHNV